MPGRKDAAYYRDYRNRKRIEQQQSKGLQEPTATAQRNTPQPVAAPRRPIDASSFTNYREYRQDLPPGFEAERIGTLVDESGHDAGVVIGIRDHRKPSFLAAPDDDCMSCGHDRQQYHTGTPYCLAPAPMTRGGVCRCPAFVDSGDPF